jgi:hypothetical protein
MHISTFKYHDRQTKQQLLLEHGSYISSRRTKQHHIFLFAISSFYAEVFYDEEEEAIVYIRSISNTDELGVYLSKIDIAGVLQETIYAS